MRHTLSGLLLFAIAVLPASAATIKLKDGTLIQCTVQSYDSATKTLKVKLEDGRDAQYTMDQLQARTVYQINASIIPKDDAKAQLMVGNFARDAGLYFEATRRYADAAKLDPKLKPTIDAEMNTLRRSAATMCAEKVRAAAEKKDFKEAEKWAKVLIEKLPDEPEAIQAAAALEAYYEQTRATKLAATEAKASEALKKDVAAGKARYEKMVEKTKQGLQARGSSQAKNLFNSAISDGEYVLKEIDRVAKKYDDSATQERAQEYRALVTQQIVEVHLHLASMLATQSDYQGGQREVSQALALDPKNAEALAMRARLEDYSSRGIGWRW
jgi:tetratricopeptide (TPR) repeat protein